MTRKPFSADLTDYLVGKTCDEPAAYRYTWPGKDESFICERHARHMRNVANAIGLPLQLIPVDDEALKCKQILQGGY